MGESRCCLPAKRRNGLVLAALAMILAAVAIVYLPTLHHEFVYDDEGYIVRNEHLQYGFSRAGVHWALTAFSQGNWHPLTWLSHMVDVQLYNKDSGRHHRGNIVLHAINTVLLFVALRAMTGAAWRSLVVAGLFALHPLRVESVAWVAERKDLLCAFFWFLGLIAWRWYLRRPAAGRYLLVTALFVCGLMSKPMIVTFPLLLLLLDVWPFGRIDRGSRVPSLVLEKAPLFALSAVSAVVTMVAQQSGGALGSLRDYPIGARIATAATAYTEYLSKLSWPAELAVVYPYRGESVPWAATLASALMLGAVTAALWRWRRRGYPMAGWCWYLGTLVPVIGIVQVGDQALADRYTYVPHVGVLIVIVWGAGELIGKSRLRTQAAVVSALVLLAALAVASSRQVRFWKDDQTLFGHAIEVAPGSWQGYGNLGLALARRHRYLEALPLYEKALSIYPDNYTMLSNFGLSLSAIGRKPEAIIAFKRAIAIQPDRALAHVNLGMLYVAMRNKAAAMDIYRRLAAIDRARAENFLVFVKTLP